MGGARGRKIEGEGEAMALLKEGSASGEPMSTWCKARGINWYSLLGFKGWLHRDPPAARVTAPVRGSSVDQGGGGARFVEVERTAVVLHRTSPRYRVVIGPRVVEVDEDFDDQVLGRLLRVVASC
jgi:hypothetical protein